MLIALRWLANLVAPPRLRPAYAYARRSAVWLVAAAWFFACAQAQGQIGDNQLKTMGLDSMWRAQLQMPIEAGSIVSTHLWTNPNTKKVYAELTLPAQVGFGKRTIRLSADTIGADGKPMGIEAAKREVEIRATRALGRAPGIPAVEVTVPMIYLVVISSDGLVQNFDAETGDLLWRNTCGPVTFPAAPGDVSDAGILVAHGPQLFLLDWKTGEHIARRQMQRASTSGVAIVGSIAFESSLSGQAAIFDFSKESYTETSAYRLFGRTITPPTSSSRKHNLVAFSTDRGIATVLSGGERIGPWFNVRSKLPLSGPITFVGDALYLSDVTGQVSKVKLDRSGGVLWRLMIGESLGAPPVVIDNVFYATNAVGELVAADDTTGFTVWPQATPRVRSILGGSKGRLYCRSLTDRLLVIDTKDGHVLSESGSDAIGNDVINHLTDRLYLISARGVIQCARQSGKEFAMPTFHETVPAAAEDDKPKTDETSPTEMPTEGQPAESADPFGAGSGTEPMAPADPSDPFAVPSTPPGGAMDSPF